MNYGLIFRRRGDYAKAREQGRHAEAVTHLKQAMAQAPADLEIRHLLMTVYSALNQAGPLCSLALETLRISPGDAPAAVAARACSADSANSGRP